MKYMNISTSELGKYFWGTFFQNEFFNNRKDPMAKAKIPTLLVGNFCNLEPSVKLAWTQKS